MAASPSTIPPPAPKPRPFRRAVLRGLAVVLPPVLTVVIFLWMAGTVRQYVLQPVTSGAREVVIWWLTDAREAPANGPAPAPTAQFNGRDYVYLEKSRQYVPAYVIDAIRTNPNQALPETPYAAYEQYVNIRYLRSYFVVPVFLVLFVGLLYVLGKLFAARVGSIIEPAIRRLPLIRSVYASVKKMTDFAFVEGEVQYRRVVAIEFPRPGIWTIGLVTGEGMLDIAGEAHEPCVTVAVPGSPVPFTGNVVTVPLRAAHNLEMTIDEALQFFISCGVVVPRRELEDRDEDAPAAASDQPGKVESR